MKALSLKQPYASWVAYGFKTIETRTWKTNFRGRMLVASSKSPELITGLVIPKPEMRNIPFLRGMALATVRLVDCRWMEDSEEDERAACCEYYDGAYAWELKDIKKIVPFPVKGRLNLFEVPYVEKFGLESFIKV